MKKRLFLIALGIAASGPFLQTTPALAQIGTSSRPPATADAEVISNSEPNRAQKLGKVLHARRISGTPPSIDGRLSDEIWGLAEAASDLTQRDPDNGKPMTDGHFITARQPRRRRRDVFIYFDNTAKLQAPKDALSLMRLLGQG